MSAGLFAFPYARPASASQTFESDRYAPAAMLRYSAPLWSGRHVHVPAFVACESPCLAAALPAPLHCAFLLRSRTCRHFPVSALSAMLLARVQSFGRFDEILYLVKKDICPHPSGFRAKPPFTPLRPPCRN
jgi:hypothetical protein